jgi:hypothetical protein
MEGSNVGRYRNVETRIWNDEKFRVLSSDAKLIFFFILTNPAMTAIGAMRATLPGMAAELGTLSKGFREGFGELLEKGLVECNETASFVGLPNFLKYNKPENPNVVKSWEKCLDLIPECELKLLTLQRAAKCAESLGEGYAKGLPIPFRNGMPNQEQEQEQEQEHLLPPLSPGNAAERKRKNFGNLDSEKSVDSVDTAGLDLGETSSSHVAVGELLSYGVNKAEPAFQEVTRAGCSPVYIREVIAIAMSCGFDKIGGVEKRRVTAGALYARIMSIIPFLKSGTKLPEPADGWVDTAQAVIDRVMRTKRTNATLKPVVAHVESKPHASHASSSPAQLKKQHGERLDALSDEQLDLLMMAANLTPGERAMVSRNGRTAPLVISKLVNALAKQDAGQDDDGDGETP